MGHQPILYWIRRDFRLSDNAALSAAVQSGRPVIPVFIRDDQVYALGAAPKWRLGLGLETLEKAYNTFGSRIIYRSDSAKDVLQSLVSETGAVSVYWSRAYDPISISRDKEIKAQLSQNGIDARSFGGHVMFEPWDVSTKTGGFFRVYTPFWNAVRDRFVETPLP
ncbi:MAG: deoxyribodipyrimidine photo-lyase, partial [Paracoccaceae bacterium]